MCVSSMVSIAHTHRVSRALLWSLWSPRRHDVPNAWTTGFSRMACTWLVKEVPLIKHGNGKSPFMFSSLIFPREKLWFENHPTTRAVRLEFVPPEPGSDRAACYQCSAEDWSPCLWLQSRITGLRRCCPPVARLDQNRTGKLPRKNGILGEPRTEWSFLTRESSKKISLLAASHVWLPEGAPKSLQFITKLGSKPYTHRRGSGSLVFVWKQLIIPCSITHQIAIYIYISIKLNIYCNLEVSFNRDTPKLFNLVSVSL